MGVGADGADARLRANILRVVGGALGIGPATLVEHRESQMPMKAIGREKIVGDE